MIQVVVTGVLQDVGAVDRIANEELRDLVDAAVARAHEELPRHVNRYLGTFEDSLERHFDYATDDTMWGSVGSSTGEARALEYGRQPGQAGPPVTPILLWVEDRGIVFDGMTPEQTAFLIARALHYLGTQPDRIQKPFAKTKDAIGDDVARRAGEAGLQIAARLAA